MNHINPRAMQTPSGSPETPLRTNAVMTILTNILLVRQLEVFLFLTVKDRLDFFLPRCTSLRPLCDVETSVVVRTPFAAHQVLMKLLVTRFAVHVLAHFFLLNNLVDSYNKDIVP